ncbi:MAG: glutathione peroxidase [Lachnospirales bacterium]
MNIYDLKVKDVKGEEVSLEKYKGKVLLIINSATECGFTPQYDDLQNMYEKFGNEKFEILDFPCNQFGNQAPGTVDEIVSFCSGRYGITFPIFSKINCNGENEELLFGFLKSEKGFKGFDKEHQLTKVLEDMFSKVNPNYAESNDIKWNFTKFLVSSTGEVLERFEATCDMKKVEKTIEKLL